MQLTTEQKEIELLQAIRKGENGALRMVYQQNFGVIARFVVNNNGTEQEAKDIYQEAVIVLYERLKDINFSLQCKIVTFLYSVSRRLWLKKLNEKSKYQGKIEDLEEFIQFEKEEENGMEECDRQFAAMKHSMDELGEPCSTVLKDFYIHQLTMQQICEKMGYTNADNAKNQKYKCLMRLKKLFFQRYPQGG